MRWTTPRVFAVSAVVAVAAFAVGYLMGPEEECPDDYWPHGAQTTTQPPKDISVVLWDMVKDAVAAHQAEPDPMKRQVIEDCIELTVECAWQDLTSHWGTDPANTKKRADHVEIIEKAAGHAGLGDWDKVKEYMTPNTPIPGETIDHPH